MTKQKLNARQACWAEYLSRFDFRISYRPGCKNRAADALSRRIPSTDYDEVRNMTLLPCTLLTREALVNLDATAATIEEDDDDGDGEDDD